MITIANMIVAIFAETRITELFEMIDIVYPFPAIKYFSNLIGELCEASFRAPAQSPSTPFRSAQDKRSRRVPRPTLAEGAAGVMRQIA